MLADAGRAHTAIYAPARLFDDLTPVIGRNGKPVPRRPPRDPVGRLKLQQAKRLLASARDLASYLSRISGATVELLPGPAPQADSSSSTPIFLAELAQARFGPVGVHVTGDQGLRVAITPQAIGLYGESDLATSYAIYELLDRLGCRWFMPGELGEEIPHTSHLSVTAGDDAFAPATLYRGVWYGDEDFKRRNRLGGVELAAGHMLERWISEEQRAQHPEWRAQIKGNLDAKRLRWSNAELAKAIADSIAAKIAQRGIQSASLSPGDGIDFDEVDDRALDAKDWDPTTNSVSLTDRLLVLANRVATQLAPQHPDFMLGVLAYVNYSRPPVRESLHPNVVPVLAPITYCREHPLSDDNCPGAKDLRGIVEGWSARATKLAFRGYVFNLAEPSAPNPMLRKYSEDLPFLLAHKLQFFQPETMPTFETTLPALYLSIRLSWDAKLQPAAVIDDLFARFYGHAAVATRRYLERIDRAWVDTPEYSGGSLGYARIFPPEVLAEARRLLDEARAACRTQPERERVEMLNASLQQLERYMKMNRELTEGTLAPLAPELASWLGTAHDLAEKYEKNSAFGKARWAGDVGIYGNYVRRYLDPVYTEATRIAHDDVLLTPKPACHFDYWLEPNAQLPEAAPRPPVTPKTMDVCRETWSSVGLHDYFGAMWYETSVDVEALPPSKRAWLWLSKVDGVVQVWLNGTAVLAEAATPAPTAEGHLRFQTYDVTRALKAGSNRITLVIRRTRLAELGAGGLLGPAYIYRER